MSLKTQLDRWEVPDEITDAHTPASLLKLWYRELYEPLIPDSMYEQCVTYHDDPPKVLSFIEQLPDINKLVLAYLINFLQVCSFFSFFFSFSFSQLKSLARLSQLRVKI